MSKKLLVATDLSVNSKAGIRFGIQLARQTNFKIVFYHAVEIDKPTRWSENQFDKYVEGEISNTKQKLERFILSIYKHEGIRPGNLQLAVERVGSVPDGIIGYASRNKFDFLCTGTRGAGKLARIIGTNTSYIIKHSPVPVFAIPKNYKSSPIKHILYATDLNALTSELSKVKRIADATKARITALHFETHYHLKEVRAEFAKRTSRFARPGLKFEIEKFNIENPLSTHLKSAVRRFDPSLLVLFTNQKRDWFDKLFLSSKSAEVSFDSKRPLLIYGKS